MVIFHSYVTVYQRVVGCFCFSSRSSTMFWTSKKCWEDVHFFRPFNKYKSFGVKFEGTHSHLFVSEGVPSDVVPWIDIAQARYFHRIGWWENLQETPINLMVKTIVSCRFSLKPIHWYLPIMSSPKVTRKPWARQEGLSTFTVLQATANSKRYRKSASRMAYCRW